MRVLEDRKGQTGHVAARRVVAVRRLHDVPAVVRAARDEVDLLILILPHVAEPERAGLRVEREAPRVPQAVGPDLAAPAAGGERVVGRDAIPRAVAYVDAQQLGEQHVLVLPVPHRIAARAAIAHRDVQVAIGSERELTAVVVVERLRDLEDHDLGRLVRQRAARGEAGDLRAQRSAARVVEEEHTTAREVGREREPEESLLAAELDVVADVEEHGRGRVALAEGEDATRLLEHVPATVRSLECAGHRVEREAAHRAHEADLRDRGRGRRHRGRCRRGRRARGRRRRGWRRCRAPARRRRRRCC